jgi:UDP-N-acetylglucosamine--N-acetylmuramyl-(pentapeptide) pyrophosphoryl-undecaprenol N-acetylglucosamine transferase
MRVLIAAGGTGGHIYPGIAVAQEILRRDSESVVRFVGTARGLETKLVRHAGFELSFIDISGLKNVSPIARMHGLALLPRGFYSARRVITKVKPDVVVGAGGYVSGPILLTAAMMRLPTLVMESNALPGWTNRVLARFVDRAAVSFDQSLRYFRGKAVVTGNPVRREFFELPRKSRNAKQFSLLIFGGSQGAHAVNQAMLNSLKELGELRDILQIRHQTGPADVESVRAGYELAGWGTADVCPYIEDMVSAFAAADLVICRAGATTTAELIAAGKAAIMVPFPFAADDHQRKNAEALEQAGAAKMILQEALNGKALAEEIKMLVAEPEKLSRMETASRQLSRGDAAAAVVDMIEELVARRQ